MILLYYFDKKEGSKVFYSYPKELLNINITNNIAKIMDISIEDGYIILIHKNKYIYNFYFEINSEWARGKKELLLLSLVFNERLSIEKEKEMVKDCNKLINYFKLEENIFMGFYTKKEECLKRTRLIKFEIRNLLKTISIKFETRNLFRKDKIKRKLIGRIL